MLKISKRNVKHPVASLGVVSRLRLSLLGFSGRRNGVADLDLQPVSYDGGSLWTLPDTQMPHHSLGKYCEGPVNF